MKRDPHQIHELHARALPEVLDGMCCMGAAAMGPGHCTCWEDVHDLDQVELVCDAVAADRSSMCHDCAFRPASPERTNHDSAGHDQEDLDALVRSDNTFWCHQGMRAIVGNYHPEAGVYVPLATQGVTMAYDPPIRSQIAFKADGTPADRCAGLAAVRRANRRVAT